MKLNPLRRSILAPPLFILVILLICPCSWGEVLGISSDGKGWLEQNGKYRVLHLSGTHAEMGVQHGELMGEEVEWMINAFVYDFAIEDNGLTIEELDELVDMLWPFVPDRYKDEMEGLSESSGVDLDDLWRAHAVPGRVHCSSIACWGRATAWLEQGGLLQTRSLDYSLTIGHEIRAQDFPLIIVRDPDDYHAWITPGFSGQIGSLGGMSEVGITISGPNVSSSSDETNVGLPVGFRVSRTLEEADTIEDAILLMSFDRTQGWNFVVGDGKMPAACAVEMTASEFYYGTWDDPVEDILPHFKMVDVVRRTNHFLDPVTAATQRDPYGCLMDPDSEWFPYYLFYLGLSLDAAPFTSTGWMSADILRYVVNLLYREIGFFFEFFEGYEYPVLWQTICCPNSGRFHVVYAEGDVPATYCQGQWYNFYDLLESTPLE